MKDDVKKRILDRKWQGLEKLGLKRPRTPEENMKRAREAHVDTNVVRYDK